MRRHQALLPALQTLLLGLTTILAIMWLVLDASWLEPVTLIVTAVASAIAIWIARLIPPVARLSESDVRDLIAASDPIEDWTRASIFGHQVMIYRWDNDLTIEDARNSERQNFTEPWIPSYWNGVSSFKVVVRRAGQPVFEMPLLSVDSALSVLPYPRAPNDLRVTRLQDTIARIIKATEDSDYPYERYIEQANFQVVESSELKALPNTTAP